MADRERGEVLASVADPSEEAAASKFWAVYVSEAEKYDKSLVQSWKSDMEGMLIFAGLFGTSLTAFIVESYKSLIPDPGDSTIRLLAQISLQLSAGANGSTFQTSVSDHFTPPASALICNTLWFISLGLSLTCALIATLLEQWARDFLHRSEMHSSPVIRARIFSYLYFGMMRFNLHAVVDIIPLLMHASLFFFFGGLIAFLFPINLAISAVSAVLLALLAVVYLLLTLSPLWCLDCPYRTPLSSACWRIGRIFRSMWTRRRGAVDHTSKIGHRLANQTMMEAISHRAMEESTSRSERDYRALRWTVKSLADDVELEPFVHCLPDVIWQPGSGGQKRCPYEDHVQRMMRDPELQLQFRIERLMLSCDHGVLSPDARRRRRITCCTALWSIASLQPSPDPSACPQSLDFTQLVYRMKTLNNPDLGLEPEVHHYSASTQALLQWSTFCAVTSCLDTLMHHLAHYNVEVQRDVAGDLSPITSYLNSPSPFPFPMKDRLRRFVYNPTIESLSEIIPDLIRAIDEFRVQTPYSILFQYIRDSVPLSSQPYRWDATRAVISLADAPFYAISDILEAALRDVVYDPTGGLVAASDWNDTLVQTLCAFWQPEEPIQIPLVIIDYLNHRNSETALIALLERTGIGIPLWSSFPLTLSHGPSEPSSSDEPDALGHIFGAIAALCNMILATPSHTSYPSGLYEGVLEALQTVTDASVEISSVNAMIKSRLLDNFRYPHHHSLRGGVPPLRSPLLPTETAISIPPGLLDAELDSEFGNSWEIFIQCLINRIDEAEIALVADFFEGLDTESPPYKAAETVRFICAKVYVPRSKIHENHQRRLANSIYRVLNMGFPLGTDLLHIIVDSDIFEFYFDVGRVRKPDEGPARITHGYAWLEDTSARVLLEDTLKVHLETLSSVAISHRIQAILNGLEALHLGEL